MTRAEVASGKWKSGNFPGEDEEPAHVRAWGAERAAGRPDAPLRPGEEVRRRRQPAGCVRRSAVAADAARREEAGLMERFDLLGPLPGRALHHGAGSQRRHRQDVRVGRAGDPLSRRGRGDAGSDAADHVQPGRQPRAARAGAPPDRRRRGRFRRSVVGRRQRAGRAPAEGHRRGARGRASGGCATRWPASTRRRSPPRTSSASWC